MRAVFIVLSSQTVQRLYNDEKSMLNIGLSGDARNCVNDYGMSKRSWSDTVSMILRFCEFIFETRKVVSKYE